MRNNLLSIGEVARMKGVGIKALRYYERIGVLLPAHVDSQTGYRYYALSQMPELDVVVTCVELGLPLKELHRYRTAEGRLDLEALLERGRSMDAIDRMAMPGFFRIRAWKANHERKRTAPRPRYIDEVWPNMKP